MALSKEEEAKFRTDAQLQFEGTTPKMNFYFGSSTGPGSLYPEMTINIRGGKYDDLRSVAEKMIELVNREFFPLASKFNEKETT